MKKKIAILQSNYIPWIGYFDIINAVDFFVIYISKKRTYKYKSCCFLSHSLCVMGLEDKSQFLSGFY